MSRAGGADPFDPLRQAPEADALEQHQALDGGGHDPTPVSLPVDADAADALEQRHSAPADQEAAPVSFPADANPADVVEQHQAVPLDEDTYDR